MDMSGTRRMLNTAAGVLLLSGLGYYVYHFGSAEGRVSSLCREIAIGMPIQSLREFATAHGLKPPQGEGVNHLVEKKTFGRHGCRVWVENQAVKESRYEFAD